MFAALTLAAAMTAAADAAAMAATSADAAQHAALPGALLRAWKARQQLVALDHSVDDHVRDVQALRPELAREPVRERAQRRLRGSERDERRTGAHRGGRAGEEQRSAARGNHAPRGLAADGSAWIDGQLAGKQWVCGNRFTLADIVLYNVLDFGAGVGQPLNPEHKNVSAWFERVGKRPSAEASIHPAAKAGGMRA